MSASSPYPQPFYQVSGAGNDFLALVEPEAAPTAEQVAAWCRRGLSLGADGLFVLRRHAGRVRMDHYNADGRRAGLCINGTRCAARLAFHLAETESGWPGSGGKGAGGGGDELTLLTGAGDVRARRAGDTEIILDLPSLTAPLREVTFDLEGRTWEGFLAQIGVPHFVVLWRGDLETAPVAEMGPALRHHPAFGEAGANVDFVTYPDYGAAERGELRLRTYERGVEAETLACGTGVLAAAAVGMLIRRLSLPAKAHTRGGFVLTVDRAGEAAGEDGSLAPGMRVPDRWLLGGDARILARGELTAEAEAGPFAPGTASPVR